MNRMSLKFDEVKTTQAAAYLIKKRGQGFMSYMKLIKLLYLADREALIRWGRSITFDSFAAMPHGMVLSRTLELINGEEPKGVWQGTFEQWGDYEVRLVKSEITTDKLSKAELKLLDEIFEKFGKKNRWELREYTHTLPEWVDPEGSSLPVEIEDILRHAGKTQAQIEDIIQDLQSDSRASSLLGSR